jgi:FKBP-type peptidyl-prolyl cis-trans isomerase FklB
MKRHLLSILTLALLTCTAGAQDQNPATPPGPKPAEPTDFSKIFKNDKEKVGYAIGMYAAGVKDRLKAMDVDYDVDMLVKGFSDSVGSGTNLITADQKMEILKDLDRQSRAKAEEKRKMAADKNKMEGAAFLAKNKAEAGVITLPDGLQYKVLTNGTGPMPKADEEVSVNYRGTLINGTEFDSSYKRGQPLTTKVQGGIIKGWTEALELMPAGSKWQLFIPSDLAYGPNGRPPTIEPNAVLIFELELLSIQPAPAVAQVVHPPSAPLTSDIIKVPSAEEIKKGAKIETIKAEDIEKEKAKANQ